MNNPYFSLIKTVWRFGKPWRKTIASYYLAYILAESCLSLSPYAFGRTIDVLQNFAPERFSEVVFWLGMSVAVLLLFWIFHGPGRIAERNTALKIQQAFRLSLYKDLTRLPLKWHQDHHSGNIIARINRASLALYQFAGSQFIYIQTIVKFLASIGFLLWISPAVGFLSFFTCLIMATIIIAFDRKLIPLYSEQNEIENHIGSVLVDYISNMTTVLTLRLGDLTHTNLKHRLMSVWPFYRKDVALNELKWFSSMIFLNFMQALILIGYILHGLNLTSTIAIGLVVMIFRYQLDLAHVFQDLSIHYSELVRMDTDVKGLQPILHDIEKLAHSLPGEALARQWHTIKIEHLEFHHNSAQQQGHVLNQISFNFKRGEKIALIGPSGGGKSTLLNLLCGLYTPSHVRLIIDDVIFDSLEPLQAITTLIPQDPEMFENTIAFNITMDLPIEPEEIHHAMTLAKFSEVLKKFPLGLETDIREKGLNLSVGQKQRLALARGLFAARFSSLILMDEPTSSVDLTTEREILSGIIKAFPDAAVIISLHRLHLLPQFDRIIMLHNGKVIANDSAKKLLSHPGPVQELWLHYQG